MCDISRLSGPRDSGQRGELRKQKRCAHPHCCAHRCSARHCLLTAARSLVYFYFCTSEPTMNTSSPTSDASSSLSQQTGQSRTNTFTHSPSPSQTAMPMFPSSLSRDPALSLPSPSVQNQIHELAKTLPPPRKQNIACDACRCARISSLVIIHSLIPHRLASRCRPPYRQRKVKCHQLPGQPKVRPPSFPRRRPLTFLSLP